MSAYPICLLGVAAALLFGLLSGCCVRHQNARPIYPYDYPACYTENFSRLPDEQRKAKQRRLRSDNDTEDWTGFFIGYCYGMWRDIPTRKRKH